jgi:hypothetical protein
MRHELEEVDAAKMHEKLTCYQKTWRGVVQKVDMTKATTPKVNASPLTPEDLVHLLDVSVASKYGADFAHLTRALVEDVCHTLNSYKQDLINGLSRQIKSMVKEVLGNTRGKRVVVVGSTSVPPTTSPHRGNEAIAWNISLGQAAELNLQQPYYQATGYEPTLQLDGMPYMAWPETHSSGTTSVNPILGTNRVGGGDVSEAVREQIIRMLRELSFSPKGCIRSYQKSYPDYFDSVPYPQGFRMPDFAKFTREDSRSTYEHIEHYLAQISDLGVNDVYRIRLFPLSLSGIAFNWFTSLAPNSVNTWVELEERFHEYFYNGEIELKFSDLMSVRKKCSEFIV